MYDTRVIMMFTNETIDSAGSALSVPVNVERSRYAAVQYKYTDASTGAYMCGSINILMSADSARATYRYPVDRDGADLSYVTSTATDNAYVNFQAPIGKSMQLKLTSATDTSVTFDGVWLILDDND